MTLLDQTTPRSAGIVGAARLISVLAALSTRLRAHRERRATRAALAKLSDHALDDIGLTRAEIDSRF